MSPIQLLKWCWRKCRACYDLDVNCKLEGSEASMDFLESGASSVKDVKYAMPLLSVRTHTLQAILLSSLHIAKFLLHSRACAPADLSIWLYDDSFILWIAIFAIYLQDGNDFYSIRTESWPILYVSLSLTVTVSSSFVFSKGPNNDNSTWFWNPDRGWKWKCTKGLLWQNSRN